MCIFIRNIGLKFSFLNVSLSGFGIRVILASLNEFGRVPTSSIAWNTEKYWNEFFFEGLVELG